MKNPLKNKKVEDAARKVRKVKDKVRDAGRRKLGGENPLSEKTRDELYRKAQELDISGRSKMNKRQLVDAIRRSR